MKYSELVEVYDALAGTTKRLEKAVILAEFMKKYVKKGQNDWVYLLLGRVFPEYDTQETGISRQLTLKAIAKSFGVDEAKVQDKFTKLGDLGEVAESFAKERKQSALFAKKLETKEIIDVIRKLSESAGGGSVGRKIDLIGSLFTNASEREVVYITRTLLGDLRIGIANALVLDALALAFFDNDKEARALLEEKHLLANDLVSVVEANSIAELNKINIKPGTPSQVMLAPKVTSIQEAFEACGKPAAFEHKYDGFRVVIHKDKGKIMLFTRKLENVTAQFPDVVEAVKKNVKGDSFILDTEVVGYDSKTQKYKPFEAISQRIRRKYDIAELQKKLPVEVNVFDVLYYNGKSIIDMPFIERRKLVEKIINEKELVIRPAVQVITDDEKVAEKFYEDALKIGEEGVMIKSIDKPYRFGRYVGYMVKFKPIMTDLDLVVTAAEYGTGKRAGWLTSYIVSCRKENEFVEVGRVSSGLKEKEEEGFTFEEMTNLLKKFKISEENGIMRVRPKVVVAVNYQNIQPSTEYTSGYAMRFPRITAYRPDRNASDIADISDIRQAFKKAQR